MKILGISGGMRNGSNDGLCKEALMGAREQGAEVEFIQLQDLHIEHCTGCTACVQSVLGGKGGGCVLKDDFDWLLDKMLDADGIIFATPIFEKGATGSTPSPTALAPGWTGATTSSAPRSPRRPAERPPTPAS